AGELSAPCTACLRPHSKAHQSAGQGAKIGRGAPLSHQQPACGGPGRGICTQLAQPAEAAEDAFKTAEESREAARPRRTNSVPGKPQDSRPSKPSRAVAGDSQLRKKQAFAKVAAAIRSGDGEQAAPEAGTCELRHATGRS